MKLTKTAKVLQILLKKKGNENILQSKTLVENENTKRLKYRESRLNMGMCRKKTLRDLKHSSNQLLDTDSSHTLNNVYQKSQIKTQVTSLKRHLVQLI